MYNYGNESVLAVPDLLQIIQGTIINLADSRDNLKPRINLAGVSKVIERYEC